VTHYLLVNLIEDPAKVGDAFDHFFVLLDGLFIHLNVVIDRFDPSAGLLDLLGHLKRIL